MKGSKKDQKKSEYTKTLVTLNSSPNIIPVQRKKTILSSRTEIKLVSFHPKVLFTYSPAEPQELS